MHNLKKYAYLCSKIDNVHLQLMKSETQIQNFLSTQTFKSEADWEMIAIFSKQRKCSLSISPTYSDTGIDIATFTTWFNNGFASGEVAEYDGNCVILGHCDLNEAHIEATKTAEGFDLSRTVTSISKLSKVSEERSKEVLRGLSEQGLQYERNKELIIKKYMPSINDRIEFYNDSIRGLGVVREIRPADNFIELYCYYIYTNGQIGYSMHETGICTVHEFNFLPMTISSQRRMNRELEKYGKVWYDKLHRIEPLVVKTEKGGKYWYINDKMHVVQETEKGTPTSQFRYIAGNYFTSREEAHDYMGKFAELLRDRLAQPEKETEGR